MSLISAVFCYTGIVQFIVPNSTRVLNPVKYFCIVIFSERITEVVYQAQLAFISCQSLALVAF